MVLACVVYGCGAAPPEGLLNEQLGLWRRVTTIPSPRFTYSNPLDAESEPVTRGSQLRSRNREVLADLLGEFVVDFGVAWDC